ncbi:UNVERIFIED_CONTAM: hypothetical protein K2H54_007366 [Gekko kuhli]
MTALSHNRSAEECRSKTKACSTWAAVQETAESQSASPEEEFQLTLEPDEEEPVPEVLVLDSVELTQDERTDPEDDDETMVEEEPEPDVPPGAILTQLLPNSHMAVIRARRQRVSALQRVGERLLEQSERNHEAMLANAQRGMRTTWSRCTAHGRRSEIPQWPCMT